MSLQSQMQATVFADHREPLLREPNRLEYLERWIPYWINIVEYPGYIAASALIGVYFLFTAPLISVVAFFAAAYFYEKLHMKKIVYSKTRHVLMGL